VNPSEYYKYKKEQMKEDIERGEKEREQSITALHE